MAQFCCVAAGIILLCAVVNVEVILAESKEPVAIKIVDAPALTKFPAMPSSHDKKLTLRAKPSPLSGPPHLQQLSDKCYAAKDKGYSYSICPFNNITQVEDRIGWNSFNGVLGIWHEWIIENDTFTGMHFSLGEACGSSDRDAKVIFNCSASTKVHDFTEPKTCSYRMILNTPLACFKGAMQVYHVLTPEQLNEWDRVDHLYYADEITHKGLSKKRRKLLIKAGLLQETKKEEITTATPEAKQSPETTSELAQCLRDKENLQKEVQEVKRRALRMVKDSPEFYHKMELVLNASSPSPAMAAAAVPHIPKDSNAGDTDEDESLLSDEVMDTLAKDLRSIDGIGKRAVERAEQRNDVDGLDALLRDVNVDDLELQYQ